MEAAQGGGCAWPLGGRLPVIVAGMIERYHATSPGTVVWEKCEIWTRDRNCKKNSISVIYLFIYFCQLIQLYVSGRELSLTLAESDGNLEVRLYWLIRHHIHFENGKACWKHFPLSAARHPAGVLSVFWSPDKCDGACPSRSAVLCITTSIYNLSRWIHNASQPGPILEFLHF